MDEECKASREKYWSECDDTQKIERMRREVKRLQREVTTLMKFMRYMQSHSHTSLDGSVVIPMFMKDEPELNDYHILRGDKGEVFF